MLKAPPPVRMGRRELRAANYKAAKKAKEQQLIARQTPETSGPDRWRVIRGRALQLCDVWLFQHRVGDEVPCTPQELASLFVEAETKRVSKLKNGIIDILIGQAL